MRKLVRTLGLVILIIILSKVVLWAWGEFLAGRQSGSQQQTLDIDKDCRMDADTGSCICRHRRTGERLSIPYDECVSLVRGR